MATIPAPGAKDDSGKPAMSSMEPVAFFVGEQIRGCFSLHPKPSEDTVPAAVLDTLNRMYRPGKQYPISVAGASWGTAKTVQSSLDDQGATDLGGLIIAKANSDKKRPLKALTGTIWTGAPLASSHDVVNRQATPEERTTYLGKAAEVYRAHGVPVPAISIHTSTIEVRQLRAGHTALLGNVLVQLAANRPQTYYSYRMFLVLEESGGSYSPVATHFRRATIELTSDAPLPRLEHGELLDEENLTDREHFIDNVPLFSGEPDAIITEDSYYEDWSYSIYRKFGESYRLIYTGCVAGA